VMLAGRRAIELLGTIGDRLLAWLTHVMARRRAP
jgi:hypothetical protein